MNVLSFRMFYLQNVVFEHLKKFTIAILNLLILQDKYALFRVVNKLFEFFKRTDVLDDKLFNVRLVFGGMAPIPKRAKYAEDTLNGKIFDSSIVKLAQLAIENDFEPITDMRASSTYRMQVAKNLIQKCQLEYQGKESIKLNSSF